MTDCLLSTRVLALFAFFSSFRAVNCRSPNMLQNREPSSPFPAGGSLLIERSAAGQKKKTTRNGLSAPSHVVVLFCPPGVQQGVRFFRNCARSFHFRAGGNGIRTHDTILQYVDLANQCLKPLSHTSKIGIGFKLPFWLSDPIHCKSRSALARVLFLHELHSIHNFCLSIQA